MEHRSQRAKEIRDSLGDRQEDFALRLTAAAKTLGLPLRYAPGDISKIENEYRRISIEDATVYAYVDPKKRGWTWVPYGVPLTKGEDAWSVLAKAAKRGAKSA